MYAIVEDSGTQIKMSTGDVLEVDRRDVDGVIPSSLTFDRVLLVAPDKGDARIGTPYLEGVSVQAEVVEEYKGEKIDVIKFKRRKGYRRKQGHRQRYLKIRVGEIITGDTPAKKKKTTKKAATSSSKKKTTKKKTTKKKTQAS
ncbi:MAG: 50S ribosomal protein L21 [Phycisphaerales bacterium]|nr:50S ribosomal protein L21 [Phycisphaerales bacterium]